MSAWRRHFYGSDCLLTWKYTNASNAIIDTQMGKKPELYTSWYNSRTPSFAWMRPGLLPQVYLPDMLETHWNSTSSHCFFLDSKLKTCFVWKSSLSLPCSAHSPSRCQIWFRMVILTMMNHQLSWYRAACACPPQELPARLPACLPATLWYNWI